MNNKKKPRVARAATKSRDSEVESPPLFGLISVYVTRLTFAEGPKQAVGPEDDGNRKLDTNITLAYGIKEPEGDRAEIRLKGSLRPDKRDKPYDIEVEVAATFVLKSGDRADLERFCRMQGATILFPYFREAVSRVSMSGRYGPVHLDPLNVGGVINQSKWRQAAAGPVEPPLP